MRIFKLMTALVICAVLSGCGNRPQDSAEIDSSAEIEIPDNEQTDPFKFNVKGFKHAHWQSDQIVFALTADEMTRHALRGRFLTFESYDELQMTNVELRQTIDPETEFVGFDAAEFAALVEQRTDDAPADRLETVDTHTTDDIACHQTLMTPKLNRIDSKPIKIIFDSAPKNSIALSADQATLNTASMNITFAGNVELHGKSCNIRSEQAIWLNKDYGFLFKDGSVVNKKRHNKPLFVKVSRSGQCVIQRRLPDYSNEDLIAETEAELIKSLPVEYRMLIGLAGMPATVLGE